MKILYYDCFSGISGDMNLGAMIDLGIPLEYLVETLKKLNVCSYTIERCRDLRRGITGTRIDVVLPANAVSEHRTYKNIVGIIEASDLSGRIKQTSLRIFDLLAEAEAKVHGCDVDDVRFHEIGAIDSIIDIVGAAVCLDFLNVAEIISSPVQVGSGFVKCAHGVLPVPAPATAEILKGVPIRSGTVPFEATTPTGAAILAATVDRFIEDIHFIPEKIGYGIGQRDAEIPNVLRVFLGYMDDAEFRDGPEIQEAVLVECNIDDMNPEWYGAVLDALFDKGASDAWLTPVVMKKSRPAVTISILCDAGNLHGIEEILWLQTTTFGLRIGKVTKKMLSRDLSRQTTKYGGVSVKNGYLHGRKIKSKPEYEDCRKLAEEKGVSIKDIYDSIPSESD
jgi:hypothetical protein